MFFVLSKTLNYLTTPLTVTCACLVASLFVGHPAWRKRLAIGGVVLLFFSNEFVANEVMRAWEADPVAFDRMRPYRLGIVLTGVVIPGLEPDDRVYFQRGADRVVHAVQLYKLGLIEKILVSGGNGRLIDIHEKEADAFREAMVLMGVPDSVILVEDATRNTHESAARVKQMLQSGGYASRDCLLITSAFHMRRSLACFRKVGLPLDSFSTDFYAHPTAWYPDSFFVPKADAIVIWHKLAREWVGFVAYWIAGYV